MEPGLQKLLEANNNDRRAVLRKLIEDNCMTQAEAAEYIGVNKNAVEHWLQGRRSVPKYAILPLWRNLPANGL